MNTVTVHIHGYVDMGDSHEFSVMNYTIYSPDFMIHGVMRQFIVEFKTELPVSVIVDEYVQQQMQAHDIILEVEPHRSSKDWKASYYRMSWSYRQKRLEYWRREGVLRMDGTINRSMLQAYQVKDIERLLNRGVL